MADSSGRQGVSKWQPAALFLPLLLSGCGLAIALWAHIVALFGGDPGAMLRGFWLFQLMLFVLIVPIFVELVQKHPIGRVLRSPAWMRRILYLLLAYYGVNFYFFVYWSSEHLDASVTWRMFSSGWLLLFSVTLVYYGVRYQEAKAGTLV